MFDIDNIWVPTVELSYKDHFSTYGSCFAQTSEQGAKINGLRWLNAEEAPYGMTESSKKAFNYGLYSSRTQNIYTPTMLRQWLEWVAEPLRKHDEFWILDGAYIDPVRPTIEPQGFLSFDEMINSRLHSVECFKNSIVNCSVFIFTLGLTERWSNSKTGLEYSVCPGTVAGQFDDTEHVF